MTWEQRYAEMLDQRDTALQEVTAAHAELEQTRIDRDERLTLRESSDLAKMVDAARAELDELKAKLRDPLVQAALALLEDRDYQFRRAEAAHEEKDAANRRWLAACASLGRDLESAYGDIERLERERTALEADRALVVEARALIIAARELALRAPGVHSGSPYVLELVKWLDKEGER